MKRWWCADDALMMRWWCTDNVLMISWWCADDALMMHWHYSDNTYTESFFSSIPIYLYKRLSCNTSRECRTTEYIYHPFFKNIPYVGSFWHFVICCICVFCICIFCVCASDTWEYHFWYAWTILFSKIYHMLGLSSTSSYAVFVYLCILYLYFLYLRVWHMGILFLISLNNPLFKNIPHAGSF